MSLSGKLGVLLICLFAMPFAAFGLFAISQAIRQAENGSGSQPFWFPLIFGVVFCSVGFGLMFVAVAGSRRYTRQLCLQPEHPTEPWLWRADWAQGRVNSTTRTNTIFLWVFAIFWNLISTPIAFLVFPAALKQKGPVALMVLIFPAVGVLLLIYAIRQTIACFEFGKTYFEMASLPGVIGRELKGVIQARFPHSPDHGVHLRLSSVHRVTRGSGNSRSTTESILWRDEADLDSGQLCPGPMGTTIPVTFHIPLDAHPTETTTPNDQYVWVLEALADVPGVNYHDTFEVPVFRTTATPSAAEEAKLEETVFRTATQVAPPERPTVEVQQTAEGTEFYFPAARNKGFALSVTFFAMIFGAITGFLLAHTHAPLIFPLVFGFFTLLIAYGALQLWLGTTRVGIGSSLLLQSGLLGGGKVRQIALSEIASIDDKITAQQGGRSGTPYYDIQLTLRDGKKLTLGRTLPNKHEAEWLVSEMRRLAGVVPRAMNASTSQ